NHDRAHSDECCAEHLLVDGDACRLLRHWRDRRVLMKDAVEILTLVVGADDTGATRLNEDLPRSAELRQNSEHDVRVICLSCVDDSIDRPGHPLQGAIVVEVARDRFDSALHETGRCLVAAGKSDDMMSVGLQTCGNGAADIAGCPSDENLHRSACPSCS